MMSISRINMLLYFYHTAVPTSPPVSVLLSHTHTASYESMTIASSILKRMRTMTTKNAKKNTNAAATNFNTEIHSRKIISARSMFIIVSTHLRED